jgi:hypothetical protein
MLVSLKQQGASALALASRCLVSRYPVGGFRSAVLSGRARPPTVEPQLPGRVDLDDPAVLHDQGHRAVVQAGQNLPKLPNNFLEAGQAGPSRVLSFAPLAHPDSIVDVSYHLTRH